MRRRRRAGAAGVVRSAVVGGALVGGAIGFGGGDAHAEESLLPSVHLGLGPAFHIEPASERAPQFAFDATAGVLLANPRGSIFSSDTYFGVEAGYAYDGLGIHAFALAPMIGYGAPLAFLAYQPRLLVGDADGDTAIGMRNGLAMHMFLGLGSVEIGHQFVSFAGALHHSLQLTFAVNPGLFLTALSGE